jgi:hypothetical protein
MPPEIVIVTVITVLAGTFMLSFIARMYFKYLSGKAGVNTDTSSSLTSSELEMMLRRVVDESNEPLLARIEGVEKQLAAGIDTTPDAVAAIKSLPAHEKNPILEDLDVPDDLAAISKRKSHTI